MRLSIIKGVIFFLLLHLIAVSAQEQPIENYNNYQSLDMRFILDASIDVNLLQSTATLSDMRVDLSFFPYETNLQDVLKITYPSSPSIQPKITKQYITYQWEDIKNHEKLSYGVDATIRTKSGLPFMTKTISFPLQVDAAHLEYTKAASFIDITPEIEKQASEIAAGETDAMRVIFKIADWTRKNIEYDLSTLTAETVQKSSWVLTNKQGVCDEITNLFISMLRSLGIPARFVSGMVYSNINYTWGPHGWAEVYLPDIGWVPFDVTFGQYGWIDPSHIKLKDDLDAGTPSAEYSWKSTSEDQMDISDAKLSTTLIGTGPLIDPFLKVHAEPYKKAVKQGSKVPLLVTIENTRNIYVAPIVVVTKAPGIDGSNIQEVLLKPEETKTIAWMMEIPPDAAPEYIYTSSIEVKTTFGNTAETEIKYATAYDPIDEEQALVIVNDLEDKAEKTTLDTVGFSCYTAKEMYYKGDPITVKCHLTSIDTQSLSLEACLRESCQDVKILPKEEREISFQLSSIDAGRLTASLEDSYRVKYALIPVKVIATPEVFINNIKPQTIPYGQLAEVSFDVETSTPIKKVTLDFGFDQLAFDVIEKSKEINLQISPKSLINGLKLELAYSDELGKIYTEEKTIKIPVTNVPWYAKIIFSIAKWFQ